jgi:serine/threonine protein kinase
MASAGSIDAEFVRALFRAAVELKPEARAKFVQDASPNEKVRLDVERLLREHELAGNTISGQPNWEIKRKRTTLSEGEVLAGRFKIIRFIAAGGMGEVYEASDIELRERVAIKTIHPDILQRQDAVVRFKREVHLARQVTHPNVCRIHDLFRHISTQGDSQEEIVFVSMEFLHGKTLSTHLKANGRMRMQEALPLVKQMAAALSAAHDAGIVHHDFKPGNVVLVGHDNAHPAMRVVVTDFGLASRSVRSGADWNNTTVGSTREVFGTPAYMAPEQIQGRTGTIASDIYAFGLVIYEMVTGEYPFDGNTPISIAMKRLSEPPIPLRRFAPELSARWEAVILRCLERDPTKRFSRAQEISAALTNGSQLSELGAVENAAGSLAVDEHPTVEHQARVLEAAAPKESAVGRSTEVVTMVRRVESGGLREYLDNEVVPSVTSEDVRERPFELDFVFDEQGKPQPVEICLRLDSPDFQPPTQTKKLRVPPRGDSLACTFLIRPTIAGELIANLELLKGEEVIVSRSIRTRALAEGLPVREGINIVSIPLTITVQDSVARVAIAEPSGATCDFSLEQIHRNSTGTHLLPLGERIPLEAEGHPRAVAREQKAPDKAELEDQELAEQVHRRAETHDSVGGKAKVVPLPQALKNTKVLTVSGVALLALVVATVWMLAPRSVPVEITRAPAGTTVRVKSTGQKCVVPVCTIELRPGQYELELSRPGYVTQSQSISVQAKGPNTFPITLGEPQVMATAEPPPPSAPDYVRLELRGVPPGELFVDGASVGKVGRNGEMSTKVPVGKHQIKVVANGKSSSVVSRDFEAGRVVSVGKDDFYASTPPSPEEVAWQSALGSPSIESVEKFLQNYKNGSHTTEARAMLESLYWTRDSQTNTADSYREYLRRYPNGQQAGTAAEEIAFLDARQQRDPAVLDSLLGKYPTSRHSKEIRDLRDDIAWDRADKNDEKSISVYLKDFSGGRHAGDARTMLAELTPHQTPHIPQPQPPQPPPMDNNTAINELLERYIKAYNDTSIEALRRIWPGMDQKQVSRLRDFFREAQNVESSYTLLEEPKVNGADATVRISQVTTFVLEGQQQRRSGTLTLKLKLAPGTSGSWEIMVVSSE